jgi:23S rRNA pseudouridine2605 synthase
LFTSGLFESVTVSSSSSSPTSPERLQKILRTWGVASRRQAESMILAGQVRVNGVVAVLGQVADPTVDQIEVEGRTIGLDSRPELIYLLLNKPRGMVSTCSDPKGRRTVLDCLPQRLQMGQGLHPVGRLDVDSTGALILTNDGALTFGLTHPSHEVPKTYEVYVEGYPSAETLNQWRRGVFLEGRKTLPARVNVLRKLSRQTVLEIVLREGRNRQIRRVADQLGHPVVRLHRSAIGEIQLNPLGNAELPLGSIRPLSQSEITFLKCQLHLPSIRATGAN